MAEQRTRIPQSRVAQCHLRIELHIFLTYIFLELNLALPFSGAHRISRPPQPNEFARVCTHCTRLRELPELHEIARVARIGTNCTKHFVVARCKCCTSCTNWHELHELHELARVAQIARIGKKYFEVARVARIARDCASCTNWHELHELHALTRNVLRLHELHKLHEIARVARIGTNCTKHFARVARIARDGWYITTGRIGCTLNPELLLDHLLF